MISDVCSTEASLAYFDAELLVLLSHIIKANVHDGHTQRPALLPLHLDHCTAPLVALVLQAETNGMP